MASNSATEKLETGIGQGNNKQKFENELKIPNPFSEK